MAMLAEPRRKQRIGPNPRGKFFQEDEDNRGRQMLMKLGWKTGDGLGAERQGMSEPIKPKVNTDSRGLGYDRKTDPWVAHNVEFEQLLKNLNNGETSSKAKALDDDANNSSNEGLEKKSKGSKSRIHYHKFVKNKDLSRASTKDISCIFGTAIDEITDVYSILNSGTKEQLEEPPVGSDVQDSNEINDDASPGSDEKQRKKKKKKSKNKPNEDPAVNEDAAVQDDFCNSEVQPQHEEQDSELATKKKKKSKRRKYEDDQEEITPNSNCVEDSQISDVIESEDYATNNNSNSERKAKKSKKKKHVDDQEDQTLSSNLECVNESSQQSDLMESEECVNVNTSLEKKKKKSKKHKHENDQEVETSTSNCVNDTSQQSESGEFNDKSEKKQKKSKKRKCDDGQEENTLALNCVDDTIQQSDLVVSEENNSKKKKRKKGKQESQDAELEHNSNGDKVENFGSLTFINRGSIVDYFRSKMQSRGLPCNM